MTHVVYIPVVAILGSLVVSVTLVCQKMEVPLYTSSHIDLLLGFQTFFFTLSLYFLIYSREHVRHVIKLSISAKAENTHALLCADRRLLSCLPRRCDRWSGPRMSSCRRRTELRVKPPLVTPKTINLEGMFRVRVE